MAANLDATSGAGAALPEIPIGFLAGSEDDAFRHSKWQLFEEQTTRKLWHRLGVGEPRASVADGNHRERHARATV